MFRHSFVFPCFTCLLFCCFLNYLIFVYSDISTDPQDKNYCSKDDCPNSSGCRKESFPEKPNFVIILADDLGYGDLASYGSPSQEWGGIDQMAIEGLRFSNAYSADSLCTPSRSGLLTGRLPIRSGMVGGRRVLFANDTGGLPKSELTIAEALKSLGYRTGMTGKWHLGINQYNSTDGTHLPVNHGFDWVGINLPLTNVWNCDESGTLMKDGPDPKWCFMYNGSNIIQQPLRHENLTRILLDGFEYFIRAGRDSKQPFFFYYSQPHVHTSLFAESPLKGTSKRGLFGDNLNELAWAVSKVTATLKDEGIERQTLVLFLSDHGPHKEICLMGGETAGLKGGKANSFEGGFRIPFIAWWPGTISPASFSTSVINAMDLFPTLVGLAGGQQPTDKVYDGQDIADILVGCGREEQQQNRSIFYYCNQHLMAIRYGEYKLHYFTIPVAMDEETSLYCPGGMPLRDWYVNSSCPDASLIPQDPPLVYDIGRDPYERFLLNTTEPKIVELIIEVSEIILKHKASIIPVEAQLGNWNDSVNPCCNPPKCNC